MRKMSKADEEELERLHEKWKNDPAEDVFGEHNRQLEEARKEMEKADRIKFADVPLQIPTKVGMEWYYRTKGNDFYVLRTDSDVFNKHAPLWVWYGKVKFDDENNVACIDSSKKS